MKGTIKDLRMAEQLAQKGRHADALKVMDRMMRIPADGTFAAKIPPMRAAILSDEPLLDDDDIAVVERGEQAEVSFNLGRMKIPSEMAGELLILRARWLVADLDANRLQAVLEISLGEMSVLIELLKDEEVKARIKPDDQATILAMACNPFYINNDYEQVMMLMGGALFRAPANVVVLSVLRFNVRNLHANLQKDNPSAIANREKYRAGIELLEPLLRLAETAAEIVGTGPVPEVDTLKRMVKERLGAPAPAAAPAVAPASATPAPPKPGLLGRLFGKR